MSTLNAILETFADFVYSMSFFAVAIFLVLALSAYASVFDFEVVDAEGKTVSLSAYKSAKAILIGTCTNSFPLGAPVKTKHDVQLYF